MEVSLGSPNNTVDFRCENSSRYHRAMSKKGTLPYSCGHAGGDAGESTFSCS